MDQALRSSGPAETAGPENPTYALPARIGTKVPANMLDPAATAAGVGTNRHRLVKAHDVLLLRRRGAMNGLAKD